MTSAQGSDGTMASMARPQGLGGLLILVQIGFVCGLLLTAFNLYFTTAILSVVPGVSSAVVYGSIAVQIISLIAIICGMVLFYRKSRHFPIFQIVLALLGIAIGLAYLIFAGGFSSLGATEIVSAFVIAGLWIMYLMKSKRVRNTFVQ